MHFYPSSIFARYWLTAVMLVWLGGCATLPDDLQQSPSQGYAHPEETLLGRFANEKAPEDKTLSGVKLLADPGDAFKARFAIAGFAEKTLDMQYYLWKGDLAGQLLFWRALEAADRGVKVRFLIDDIYHSGRDKSYALFDTHPNVEVRVFNPMANRTVGRNLNFVINKRHLNHRMHNKIFMADNAVAVLGGRNIGNDYFGVDTQANFFDLDVLTVGKGATEAGAAFDEYWNSRYAVPIMTLHKKTYTREDLEEQRKQLRESLHNLDALPYALNFETSETLEELRRWRDDLIWAEAHVVVDPLERFEGQGESALIEFTEEWVDEIDVEFLAESAYLIPSKQGLENIRAMSDRGVRVRLLTNSLMSNNHLTAHSGYMKYRKAILEAGAELHELRADAALRDHFRANRKNSEVPAGIHTKSFVIDGQQALIGSFNFDPRSRDLNSEIGLVVSNREFAHQVVEQMNRDFHPENSYRLFLNENGKLRWEITNPDGSATIFKHDPGASIWKRTGARILSWLPIEKEL
ncbi:MAG: phospholipase D family protein [Xanthomonadales bacterium]|jgi:putative cardiolipin synthase|nr:phospholipase D family protein [Xanthomonadales bacterium]MDH3924231.1 phospholipase D family protein [Xanthomonadales bacterium]MDH3940084.1 phospholipase D family protein [Xanthomonadales bacterium]MDH3999979.1 phospholipase D family protein [Xanthomonadales bacterium]